MKKSFLEKATPVGFCSAVYPPLVFSYAILGFLSDFGQFGLLGDGVGTACCVADAQDEREFERVWWSVCKLCRRLMVCNPCR
jgi:hypothetical protein